MVDRRNSSDANFLFDSSLQNDHLKEDNAIIASDNEIRLATFVSSPTVRAIGNGLTLVDGTAANTIKITAGWAIDDLGRQIILTTDIDNIALPDGAGGANYVAIHYANTYSSPRVARGNGVEYNTTIQDSYITDVAVAQQPVGIAPYWIWLGTAAIIGGVRIYGMAEGTLRDYRWRKNDFWNREFGWSDGSAAAPVGMIIPAAESWLCHQGVISETMRMPYAGYIDRLYVQTSVVPVQIVTWRVRIAGVAAFSMAQGAAVTTANIIYSPPTAMIAYPFAAGDTIHVTAQGAAPTASLQAIATVAGGITGW
jgi:hypothetical protein